jgi:ketosteroid isomerase-like protein
MPAPLEVVNRAIERFNAGDLDGFVALFAPDAEFHDVPEVPGSTTYRGHDGMREWATTVLEAMDGLRFEISDPAESGDAVAVRTRAVASGRGSCVAVDWTFTTVWRVRDGLIAYHHGYSDRAEALRALDRGADSP